MDGVEGWDRRYLSTHLLVSRFHDAKASEASEADAI